MTEDLLIVGAGPMARAHARAAQALGQRSVAVCRSPETAAAFTAETGLPAMSGGLNAWLDTHPAPAQAVVAVGVADLAATTTRLIEQGVRRILVEKPGGLDAGEMDEVAERARAAGAEVFLAYNRRFYASVQRANEIIASDGGVSSIRFEFTELAQSVAASSHPEAVKRAWLLANSTHVIDLAFHLAGAPAELSASVQGGLDWHPSARFAGFGETVGGGLFSYHSDWTAPGRWSIDVRTAEHRLLLEPMETLRMQKRGSFSITDVELPAEEAGHKPGVLGQMAEFLSPGGGGRLVTIAEQAIWTREVYGRILNGTSGAVRPALMARSAG
jgi:predicted dehydrogenase